MRWVGARGSTAQDALLYIVEGELVARDEVAVRGKESALIEVGRHERVAVLARLCGEGVQCEQIVRVDPERGAFLLAQRCEVHLHTALSAHTPRQDRVVHAADPRSRAQSAQTPWWMRARRGPVARSCPF